ncbi:uncharacterized protein LOC108022663 [Drosophila biarmipes]|uniref:uncharacterized protein LOC108022663 n=1 Tax=Drosophila biarmipes TaxID=125945 RepID=UPI0007E63541|nr:uncharacterized protein LOC108022663 [Drosophila biarmipes]
MNLEDISVVMKLCDDNVQKLQGNLQSYQRDVRRIKNMMTKRWEQMDRLDKSLIAQHDQLVGSLTEVNAYIIKLNLHIELNRPSGQFGEEERSEDSLDEPYSPNNSSMAVKGVSSDELDELPPEKASAEKSMEPVLPPSTSPKPVSTKNNRSLLAPKNSTQTISNDICKGNSKEVTHFQTNENPVIIKSLAEEPKVTNSTSMKDSQQRSISLTPLEIEDTPEVIKSFQEELKVANSDDISKQDSKNTTPLQIEETPKIIESYPFKASPEIIKSIQREKKVSTSSCNDICQQKFKKTTSLQIKESPEITNSVQGETKLATLTINDISNQNSTNVTPLQAEGKPSDQISVSPPATTAKLSKAPRSQNLLAPKGGTQTSSTGIYNQILKNMAAFPARTLVTAALVHVNLADDCIYVAKWDESTQRIQKVLQGQVVLQELAQLPDYGDIFAVLDSSDDIITRMTINSSCAGGGYYGYLIDYGEHIHLNGNETIYELPDDIRRLPAEAIRGRLINYDIAELKTFLYKNLKLRVLENNGIELVLEVIEDNLSKVIASNENKTYNERRAAVSEADMAMLNDIEESTSDPLKAVLGFRPTDEQRICRHYDPQLNGCFKGNNCRLVHEPFAPYGATKDVEVAGPLPETVFDTPVPYEIGSIVRILITFVNGPTEVYAQFLDGSAPLVWEENDVPENKRHFKQKPRILDIVLALYSDGCFYRAQIIDELDKEYKIFYVDYGNTEFVPLSSLAPCGVEESLKPHRCISCQMEGVVRAAFLTHEQTFECVEYLKSKVLNREMDVKLVNRLPDGFMIRFLDDWKEVPRHLINRRYVDPVFGKKRGSEGEQGENQPLAGDDLQ